MRRGSLTRGVIAFCFLLSSGALAQDLGGVSGIVIDARTQERIIPENPHSTLIFADGSTLGCFVIDMSVTGAAVSADVQPAIGAPLAVGRSVGRVVRHFAEGFAVKFERPVDRDYLEHLIIKT